MRYIVLFLFFLFLISYDYHLQSMALLQESATSQVALRFLPDAQNCKGDANIPAVNCISLLA